MSDDEWNLSNFYKDPPRRARPPAPVVQPTVCPECGSSDPKKFGKKCYLIERRHVFHRSGVIDTPEEESDQ